MPAQKKPVRKTKSKQMGTVTTAPYRSPITDYCEPDLGKVATDVQADDPSFLPLSADLRADRRDSLMSLRAYLPGMRADGQPLTLPFRASATVDCGCNIQVPSGYKLVLRAHPKLAEKGVFVLDATEGTRMKVVVMNMGREIVMLRHGDEVAVMEVERRYVFDWVKGGL